MWFKAYPKQYSNINVNTNITFTIKVTDVINTDTTIISSESKDTDKGRSKVNYKEDRCDLKLQAKLGQRSTNDVLSAMNINLPLLLLSFLMFYSDGTASQMSPQQMSLGNLVLKQTSEHLGTASESIETNMICFLLIRALCLFHHCNRDSNILDKFYYHFYLIIWVRNLLAKFVGLLLIFHDRYLQFITRVI